MPDYSIILENVPCHDCLTLSEGKDNRRTKLCHIILKNKSAEVDVEMQNQNDVMMLETPGNTRALRGGFSGVQARIKWLVAFISKCPSNPSPCGVLFRPDTLKHLLL